MVWLVVVLPVGVGVVVQLRGGVAGCVGWCAGVAWMAWCRVTGAIDC